MRELAAPAARVDPCLSKQVSKKVRSPDAPLRVWRNIMDTHVAQEDKPDCRQQFMHVKRAIRRWLLVALLLFFGAIPYMWVVTLILGRSNWTLVAMLPYFIIIFKLVSSILKCACPNCGKSPFVLIYVGNVPVLAKSWIGNSCNHCGARLQ